MHKRQKQGATGLMPPPPTFYNFSIEISFFAIQINPLSLYAWPPRFECLLTLMPACTLRLMVAYAWIDCMHASLL